MDRMPADSKMKLSRTFEDQKDLVNEVIIPIIKKSVDVTNTFPVVDGILYDMIHKRHRYQRELHKLRERDWGVRDQQARRKHKNSR